jgi:hypothetical protein
MTIQEELEIIKKETNVVFGILYPIAGFIFLYSISFQLLEGVPVLVPMILLILGSCILFYTTGGVISLRNRFIYNIASGDYLIPKKFFDFYRLKKNIRLYEGANNAKGELDNC